MATPIIIKASDRGKADQPPDDRKDADRLLHEINNLLDGSLRQLSLGLQEIENNDDTAPTPSSVHRLQLARDGLQRMANLMVRWNKQQREPDHLHTDSRPLSDTIHHAVRLLTAAAEYRGIQVRLQLHPDFDFIPGRSVYPVIANAVRNSIEAIERAIGETAFPEDRRFIHVIGSIENGQVRIDIDDGGPGLPQEILATNQGIQPGFTTKPGGHGLGLSLCHDIARSLGGSLSLSNPSPYGARVTLIYPVPREETVIEEESEEKIDIDREVR